MRTTGKARRPMPETGPPPTASTPPTWSTVTTPSPDGSQPGQTTTFYYDRSLRTTNTVKPDQASVLQTFYPNGLPWLTSGARTYPVAYSVRPAGPHERYDQLVERSRARARVTTWNDDLYRGWLASKTYEGGVAGPVYSNSPAGRLAGRLWARNIAATYSHNAAGELSGATYSDGTPSVTYGADRRGRQTTTTQGDITTTRTYDEAGDFTSESYSGGPLAGLTLTNQYDGLLRRTNLALLDSESLVFASTSYAYDAASA